MIRRIVVGLIALMGLWVGPLSGPLAAHEARPLYVEITEQGDGEFDVLWRVPPAVSTNNIPLVSLSACEAAGPARRTNGSGGVVGRHIYQCPDGLGGSSIEVAYPAQNPAVSTLVRLVWLSGESHSILASPEEMLITLPDQETGSGVAQEYTTLGIKHILLGYDHLLFVACLILIAGTFRRILVTITGFTIAHSITLAMAALGIVRVPVPAVEAAIALSIVFLAVEIARGNRESLTWRHPVAVSVTFGLLHGFGFASVLNEIGLPQTEVPVALLFFNIGVETGQIMFVVMLLAAFAVMRQMKVFSYRVGAQNLVPVRFNVPASYVVGSLASFWMISRVAAF